MSLKRAAARAGALLPLSLLVSCTEQDVGEAIEEAIIDILGAIGKVLLISLGLVIAWAAIVACGVALIALGVRRKRFDAGSVGLLLPGVVLLVSAWPVVFTEDGLGGVWAPGSLPDASAGPLLVQGLIAAGVVGLIVMFVQRRRARRGAPPPGPMLADPMPPVPPPPPSTPPRPQGSVKEPPAPAGRRRPASSAAGAPARRATSKKRPASKSRASTRGR